MKILACSLYLNSHKLHSDSTKSNTQESDLSPTVSSFYHYWDKIGRFIIEESDDWIKIIPKLDTFSDQITTEQKQQMFKLFEAYFEDGAALTYDKKQNILKINWMIIDKGLLDFFFELINEDTKIMFENVEIKINWNCWHNCIEELAEVTKKGIACCQSVVLSARSKGLVCHTCE